MSERRVGWMAIEDSTEDGSYWSGHITSPNPKGANLAWLNPIPMVELIPGDVILSSEQAQKIHDALREQRHRSRHVFEALQVLRDAMECVEGKR